jgi:hypothetical protein
MGISSSACEGWQRSKWSHAHLTRLYRCGVCRCDAHRQMLTTTPRDQTRRQKRGSRSKGTLVAEDKGFPTATPIKTLNWVGMQSYT